MPAQNRAQIDRYNNMMLKKYILASIVLTLSQFACAQFEEDADLLNEIALTSQGIQQEFEAKILGLDQREHLLAGLFLRTSQNVHDTAQHARTALLLVEVVDPKRIGYATQLFNVDMVIFTTALARDVEVLGEISSKTGSSLLRKASDDLGSQVVEFQRLVHEIRGKGR